MKKIIALALAVAFATVAIGRFNLGDSGAMRFLTKMESLVREGKTAEVCAMFHDDLRVEIADHAGDHAQSFRGGKKEFCELAAAAAPALNLVPHSMEVEFTDVHATQSLIQPWSSDVSYAEHRTLTIPGTNTTFRTVSNDQIRLVQTLSGVKLRKVKSEIYKTDAT